MTEAAIPYLMGASVAVSGKSAYDARKARKEDKEAAKKLEADRKKQAGDRVKAEMKARSDVSDRIRMRQRAGQARGRASTILDKSGTLG